MNSTHVFACAALIASLAGCAALQPEQSAPPPPNPPTSPPPHPHLTAPPTPRTHNPRAVPPTHPMQPHHFWFPADTAAAQAARTAASDNPAEEVPAPPAKLNFGYRISGPAVPWRPIEAFDDGSHEYLL